MIPHRPDYEILPDAQSGWDAGVLGDRQLRPLLNRVFRGEFAVVTHREMRGVPLGEIQECLHVRVPWRRKVYRLIVVGVVEDGVWSHVVEAGAFPDLQS